MADIIVRRDQGIDRSTLIRFKDIGGGQFARVIAAIIESGNIIVDSGSIHVTGFDPQIDVDVIDRAARELGLVGIIDADNTRWSQPDKDAVTGASVNVPYEHHEIHEGTSFHCWYEQTVSDIGDRTIITFRTPNTATRVHMIPSFLASGAAHALIREAATVTDDAGAPLEVYNRERASATPSGVWDTSQNPDVANQATYFTEVTQGNVTVGDEFDHWHLQIGGGNRPPGGGTRGVSEWVLLVDTLYAFEIESDTDDNNICLVRLDWYEKEPEA